MGRTVVEMFKVLVTGLDPERETVLVVKLEAEPVGKPETESAILGM